MGAKVYKENKCPAKKDVLLALDGGPCGRIDINVVNDDGEAICTVAVIDQNGIATTKEIGLRLSMLGYDTSWTTFDTSGRIYTRVAE